MSLPPSQEFSPGDIDPLTNNAITDVTPQGQITSEVDEQGQVLAGTTIAEAQRAAVATATGGDITSDPAANAPPAPAVNPSQEFSPGDIDPLTNNAITDVTPQGQITSEVDEQGQVLAGTAIADAQRAAVSAATAAAPGAGFDPEHNTELGGSYARSYDRAQATIAADPDLSRAVTMAERAGDMGFRDRLATIMADLEQNRPAALDAIRGEVFASQMRNRTGISGADAISALATLNAMDRLTAMQPDLGIGDAREQGFRSAVNSAETQRQTFYSIVSNPNLSFGEKMDRLAAAGITDAVLASSLIGIGLGPRVGARTPVASEPTVGRADLDAFRTRIGVPTTETVGVGRTNVPGLERMTFEGASPRVRDEAGLPRATPGPIAAPSNVPLRARAHAEEDIANQFVRAVEAQGLQPADLQGRTLTMHISNPTGVCTTCRQGLDSTATPGVLRQLSERYPDLNIRVTVETQPGIRPMGPTDFTIRNGQYVTRNDR